MNLTMLKIEQVVPGDNIRKDITKESLASLITSIKDRGILQPLLVKAKGEKFELIDGYRRFNAAKYAELKDIEIPVLIKEIKDDDRIETQLIANLQRENINPIDEALAYKGLGEEYKASDLMVITGKSEYRIKRILSLLNLCAEVKELVKNRELSEEHGVVIAKLHNTASQKALATEIKREKLSPREAESKLERYSKNITNAAFDKTQCKSCTFNGSTMKDMFDKDNDLNGQCLNLDCFFKKVFEFQKLKEAEFKKKGIQVIVMKEEPKWGSKEYKALEECKDFSGYNAEGFDKQQYETECSKTCKTFAAIINPFGQVKMVCMNEDCFNKSLRRAKASDRKATSLPKTGDLEKDASISFELKKKESRVDLTKRDFYMKNLKDSLKEVQASRLLVHLLFQLEKGNAETISELLGLKKQANWQCRDFKRLAELTHTKAQELIKALVLGHLQDYSTEELEAFGDEAGLNIGKQFVITQEYLEKFSKAGLSHLAKELKLKVGSLVWKDKKDEIIKTMLASGCKGKVPKEMLK
jgi:ParB family chromosome partitioning protein